MKTILITGVSSGLGRAIAEATLSRGHRVFDPARAAGLSWGDPAALGRVVASAIEAEAPPLHLLVGPTALNRVRAQLASFSAEIDRWQDLSWADGEG